jgi:hypothetical protein
MRSLKKFSKKETKKTKYDCENARQDINLVFFEETSMSERDSAIWRILKHIMHGDLVEIHHINCKKCYRYYQKKKRKHSMKLKILFREGK